MEKVFELLRATVAEFGRDPVVAAIGMLLLVVLGVWGDLAGAEVMRLSFLSISVTSFILQYVLTRRTMRKGGLLAVDAQGNVSGFFGLCFLANLGILLGFTLLIVPGIWLYARWIASGPVLFAEDMSISEALASSAERTRPMLDAIIGVTCIVHLPFVAGIIASVVAEEASMLSIGVSTATNIGMSVSQLAGWYLAVAIYRAVQPQPLADVFA